MITLNRKHMTPSKINSSRSFEAHDKAPLFRIIISIFALLLASACGSDKDSACLEAGAPSSSAGYCCSQRLLEGICCSSHECLNPAKDNAELEIRAYSFGHHFEDSGSGSKILFFDIKYNQDGQEDPSLDHYVEIRNTGKKPAKSSYFKFSIFRTNGQGEDEHICASPFGSGTSLSAGGVIRFREPSYCGLHTVNIVQGTYKIRIRLDPDNEVPENDEKNNVINTTVLVNIN